MLKLELRQELKLVLKMVLKILQAMRLGQTISLKQIQEIDAAVHDLSRRDLLDLAHESVRRGGLAQVYNLGYTLKCVATLDADTLAGLAGCAQAMIEMAEREERRRDAQVDGPMLRMTMRLIMREPHFFGGRDGTPESLADLLTVAPQRNKKGRVEWVLAGGWAVELLTGKTRHHHDIDAVLMTNKPLHLDSDVQHTDDYFGIISCTRRFLNRHCRHIVQWQHQDRSFDVQVLCPEYLFLSKFLRQPRDKDWQDVVELVARFAADWNLELMRKLVQRNCCGFDRTRELMTILQLRVPSEILARLELFWQ